MAHTLYKNLLTLYPRRFSERLGESMLQTFNDLCNEKRQTKKGFFSFVLWIFVETSIGIMYEHTLLIKEKLMKNILKNIALPAGVSFLMLLPFLLMEIVNRQSFRAAGEEFPVPLFIFLFVWGMVFISILVPIVQSLQARRYESASPAPELRDTITKIPADPKSTEISALVLTLPFLAIGAMQILNIEPPFAQALNQPDPDKPNFYNTVIPIGAFLLAIAGALFARTSIVQTLQSQGRLFARPISLIIVLLMLLLLAWNWVGFVIDQWPCFLGVPGCD